MLYLTTQLNISAGPTLDFALQNTNEELLRGAIINEIIL